MAASPVRGHGPQQPRCVAGPSAATPALMNRSCPEPNSPGGTIDRRDEEITAAKLLGGKVAARRLRVTDREHRIDLLKSGEMALHDVHAAIPRALAILIVGQDLDLRVLGQGLS